MVDLREKVKEDRGLLKKIELAIPGFRGYRKREDLRIADSLLRTQLADWVKSVTQDLEQCRESLTKKMDLDALEDVGNLIDRSIALEGKILHAEQGYTGISADFRIEEDAQNRLYEWDLGLITSIDTLKKSTGLFHSAIHSGDAEVMKQEISHIDAIIQEFTDLFEKRRDAIAGLGIA
jgi:hypothetical protein